MDPYQLKLYVAFAFAVFIIFCWEFSRTRREHAPSNTWVHFSFGLGVYIRAMESALPSPENAPDWFWLAIGFLFVLFVNFYFIGSEFGQPKRDSYRIAVYSIGGYTIFASLLELFLGYFDQPNAKFIMSIIGPIWLVTVGGTAWLFGYLLGLTYKGVDQPWQLTVQVCRILFAKFFKKKRMTN